MNIHQDFEEFLRLLNEKGVEYLIVGGYAVAFYGYVRATNDMDLFFRNNSGNIRKIADALEAFGIISSESELRSFSDPGSIIRMGVPPVRIAMINNISGLSFDVAWRGKTPGIYGETPVFYLSYQDLITNKRDSGRPKDLADIDELSEDGTTR